MSANAVFIALYFYTMFVSLVGLMVLMASINNPRIDKVYKLMRDNGFGGIFWFYWLAPFVLLWLIGRGIRWLFKAVLNTPRPRMGWETPFKMFKAMAGRE